MSLPPFSPSAQTAYAAIPQPARDTLLALRSLIYDVATTLDVGRIEETTKWGQPSYTTPDTKSATPIRLGVTKSGDVAVFIHCQTTVMGDFRALAPPDMRFDGNRAVLLPADQPPRLDEIRPLIRAALTYHI